jgi:hypothetical protein
MPNRNEVYEVIDGERAYQDAGRGNAKRHENAPPQLSPGECLLCMEELLADARRAWYKPDGATAMLPFIRKATAVGVQLMENYGAPPRE